MPLKLIDLQSGSYLGEGVIARFGDRYAVLDQLVVRYP
ncbi:hypothetical protein [Vreelandella massiliensis]